jgi:hypothetical protein
MEVIVSVLFPSLMLWPGDNFGIWLVTKLLEFFLWSAPVDVWDFVSFHTFSIFFLKKRLYVSVGEFFLWQFRLY